MNLYLIILFLATILLESPLHAKTYKSIPKTKEEYLNSNNSPQCYCAGKCGPREIERDDYPVFVENDPNGHYLYCRPWDLTHYARRCKAREDADPSEVEDTRTFDEDVVLETEPPSASKNAPKETVKEKMIINTRPIAHAAIDITDTAENITNNALSLIP